MKKEDIFVVLGIGTIILFFVLAYMSLTAKPEKEMASISPTPQQQIPAAPQDGNFNPQYGALTPEQITIADMAIGKLLNSTEGLAPPMITVVDFQQKEFSDSSLDCPKADQMYSQVITPGYQVMLEAQGKTYDFRLTDEENVTLCEQ